MKDEGEGGRHLPPPTMNTSLPPEHVAGRCSRRRRCDRRTQKSPRTQGIRWEGKGAGNRKGVRRRGRRRRNGEERCSFRAKQRKRRNKFGGRIRDLIGFLQKKSISSLILQNKKSCTKNYNRFFRNFTTTLIISATSYCLYISSAATAQASSVAGPKYLVATFSL